MTTNNLHPDGCAPERCREVHPIHGARCDDQPGHDGEHEAVLGSKVWRWRT